LNCIYILYDIPHQGSFGTRHFGLYDSIVNIGYVIALLLPVLIADFVNKVFGKTSLLPSPIFVSGLILGVSIFSLLLAASRNGLLIMLLAFVLGGIMVIASIE
jgi:hypothetical protein